jgi:hypothetical protein
MFTTFYNVTDWALPTRCICVYGTILTKKKTVIYPTSFNILFFAIETKRVLCETGFEFIYFFG